jgi:hypothetical protein
MMQVHIPERHRSRLTRLVGDDSVRAYVGSADANAWIELPARQLPVASYHDARFLMTPRGALRNANWDT